jgi:lipopolysaccharide biosynthesis glycosyltransferase
MATLLMCCRITSINPENGIRERETALTPGVRYQRHPEVFNPIRNFVREYIFIQTRIIHTIQGGKHWNFSSAAMISVIDWTIILTSHSFRNPRKPLEPPVKQWKSMKPKE